MPAKTGAVLGPSEPAERAGQIEPFAGILGEFALKTDSTDPTAWWDGSSLAADRAQAEAALDPANLRALEPAEIKKLEHQGNRCGDWNLVRVASDFLVEAIIDSDFRGDIRLGRFSASDPGRPGIYDSSIEDAVIAGGARVFRCGQVSRVSIGEGAVLESVGRLGMSGPSSRFGNGGVLFEGPLFSRRLAIAAGLPFELAAWATGPEGADPQNAPLLESTEQTTALCTAAIESTSAYVGPGSTVRFTSIVEDCWIGRGVEIDGANSLRNSTVWGSESARTRVSDGAHLAGALVGPGCTLAQQCTVQNSLFSGFALVEHQAIVKGSVVGPNARLAECEINDSVLGPFTTAVHHALVIAAWWPEGRGNVGYGANVGSNHTGRAPDQEIWPGEGMFFGLGSNIKFPCNFREAPYSIVATGVDTLPQKVTFPFSLIATPFLVQTEGVPPAYNEIRPGWAILHNAYGLARLEQNLQKRDRTGIPSARLAIFRPEIVKSMSAALEALESLDPNGTDAYTDLDLAGLGKNYITEAGRGEGLRAYRLGMRHGAAVQMLIALTALIESKSGSHDEALATLEEIFEWAGPILQAEDSQGLVESILKAEHDWVEAVTASRRKDEKRGTAIIDDYAARHVSIDEDPVIIELRDIFTQNQDRRAGYTELAESNLYKKTKA